MNTKLPTPRFLLPLLPVLLWVVSGCATPTRDLAPFTIVVLPDTQEYVDQRTAKARERLAAGVDRTQIFLDQTSWIRDTASPLNTKFVVHEGDITQTDDPGEWARARDAMNVLDGVVPYCLCLGNHDMGCQQNAGGGWASAKTRDSLFEMYFPRTKYAHEPWFGGSFDNTLTNAYYFFSAAGMDFLILSLEFKPRNEVLEWAGGVLAEHPERRSILLTHSYLYSEKDDSKRIGGNGYDVEGNHGEAMWQKVVRKHANVFLVLCGHVLGEGRRVSTGDHGNPVHEVLCDYQGLENGGNGWLRYMTFHPAEDKIEVYTYSPTLDELKEQPSSRFSLEYKMLGTVESIARVRPSAR
jgi:hypothetical protein